MFSCSLQSNLPYSITTLDFSKDKTDSCNHYVQFNQLMPNHLTKGNVRVLNALFEKRFCKYFSFNAYVTCLFHFFRVNNDPYLVDSLAVMLISTEGSRLIPYNAKYFDYHLAVVGNIDSHPVVYDPILHDAGMLAGDWMEKTFNFLMIDMLENLGSIDNSIPHFRLLPLKYFLSLYDRRCVLHEDEKEFESKFYVRPSSEEYNFQCPDAQTIYKDLKTRIRNFDREQIKKLFLGEVIGERSFVELNDLPHG